MGQEIIKLVNISKTYDNKKVLDNLNFSIKKGKITALLGHNGAGKSTTANIIMNLINYEGKVGYEFSKAKLYKKVQYQLQNPSYEENARVFEICKLYKDLLKGNENIEELLNIFHLDKFKKSKINSLSGGQKQKLSVLLTLIGNPEVIIFDEISTGLDPISRIELWEYIKKIKATKNISIILTSHFLDEVEYLADDIIILRQGKLISQGDIDEIVDQQFGDKKRIIFSLAEIELEKLQNYKINKLGKDKYEIIYSLKEEEIFILLKRLGATNISLQKFSFEDAFFKINQEDLDNNFDIQNNNLKVNLGGDNE